MATASGVSSGLVVEAFPVPGKPPVHLEGLGPASPGDNVGLRIREPATGHVLVYLSAVARVTPEVLAFAESADCLFFDGTFWSDDELREVGSDKRAKDLANLDELLLTDEKPKALGALFECAGCAPVSGGQLAF